MRDGMVDIRVVGRGVTDSSVSAGQALSEEAWEERVLRAEGGERKVTTKHAKDAKMGTRLVFKDESYKIIGACFEVYKEKGSGFLEAVYQECLCIEFAEQGLPFVEKPRLLLEYKGRELKQEYEPDFLCFEIIVEIKAVKQLTDVHRAQAINYLKSTGKQLGMLINFGHYPKMEHERFVNQPLSRLSRVS